MKTIKDLADICGVSKTAINSRIKSLNIIPDKNEDGTKLLSDQDAQRIIDDFERSRKGKAPGQAAKNSSGNDDIIAILTEQLRTKDKQIEELQKLVSQEQQLRLVADQRILALEAKDEETTGADPDEDATKEPARKWWKFF